MSMSTKSLAAGPAAQGQLTAAQQAQQLALLQRQQNRRFMSLSVNKAALCQQSNGGANSQAFAVGQPLTYNVTTANNAFLTGFWVRCSLTVTLAATGAPVWAQNAASPLSLIDSVNVLYGGTQHNFRPYILKYLSQLQGESGQIQPRLIVAGQQSSYLQSYYSSGPFLNATGANTYNFAFFVPMNLIHPQDVRGILPIQNGETTCQIVINCAGAPLGTDPLLNTFTQTIGTVPSATVTGTVTVISQYKDGQSFSQLTALQPNLSGLETVQIMRDAPLNNLSSGQVFRNKVSFLHKMPWLFITVIDGMQSNKFMQTSNLQLIETTADQTGNRPFWRYGLNTNLDVRAYYDDLSGVMGGILQQDLDEGIFPLVYGPIFAQADAGVQEGQAYLNMSVADGWTDFHYGAQVGAVGALASPGPRIECTAIILNDPLVV